MEKFYTMEINGQYFNFPLNEEDKDKYVLVACAKNENDYIKEFVEHHLNIGFDKIFIANNDDDQTLLSTTLKEYVDNGSVELFNFYGFKGFQLPLYNMFLNSGNYKWCAFFDVDEFLEISGKYDSVKNLLDNVQEGCYMVNWMLYGANDQLLKLNGTVQERFKLPVFPLSFKENMFMKAIVRGGVQGYFSSPHTPVFVDGTQYNISGNHVASSICQVTYPVCFKEAYLKHYNSKSFEEWLEKVKRGWPDNNEIERLKNYEHFTLLNKNYNTPMEFYSNGLFSFANEDKKEQTPLTYDVIAIKTDDKNPNIYSLLGCITRHMKAIDGNTYMVDKYMDECLYNEILEIAIRTGNRLVAVDVNDSYEMWTVYLKYHKRFEDNYYIITAF